LLLEVALESDFADPFDVRRRTWQLRDQLQAPWSPPNWLEAHYPNQDFVRRCLLRTLTDRAGITYANGSLLFPVDLQPGQEWRLCLQYDLLTSDEPHPHLAASCPLDDEAGDEHQQQALSWQRSVSRIEPSDIRLQFAYERASEDLSSLPLHAQAR